MHRKQFQNIAILFGGILIVLLQIILSNSLPGFTGTDDKSIEKINEQKKSLATSEDGTDLSNASNTSEQKDAENLGNSVINILKNRGTVKK